MVCWACLGRRQPTNSASQTKPPTKPNQPTTQPTAPQVSHYALTNISPSGRATTLNAFKTLAYVSEGVVFIYVGMDALSPSKWKVGGWGGGEGGLQGVCWGVEGWCMLCL